MKTRIRQLRKELGLSQLEFSKALGMSTRTRIGRIECDKAVPSETMLNLICVLFNVNHEWLVSGEGPMFSESGPPLLQRSVPPQTPSKKDQAARFVEQLDTWNENDIRINVLYRLSKLSDEDWKGVARLFENV